MKSNNNYSEGYANYLKNIKREKVKVLLIQIALLIGILVLWEILANAGIMQTFLFSKPSDIYKLFIKYISNGELMKHVGISVYETVLGLVIGTVLGILVAIALWWSEKLSKILDPFLVVLNALPKTALAPIIIVWAGAGIQGIVVTAVTISVVVTILSAYNYFINVDEEKIKMCEIVTAAGADYIKTSTGFSHGGATVADVELLKAHVGENVKIKAAGGIKTLEDAEKLIEAGASRLGTSKIVRLAKEQLGGE